MNNRDDSSVEELRRQSEHTRAELASTVTELRERVSDTASEIKTMVSPAHIKGEIKAFVREERDSLRQNLEARARENPLQAVAVGAALAYPALGLLRAVPAPLLLIAAGLFLTSKRGKATMADATAKTSELVDQGLEIASSTAADLKDAVVHRAEPLTRALEDAGDAVMERTDAVAQGVRRTVHDLRDAASNMTSNIAGAAETASGDLSRQFHDGRTQLAPTVQRSKSALMDWVDQNPLILAGIGAAAGAFIAAALPRSDAENAVLGKSSDALKNKARQAASDGLQKAKDFTAHVADDVKAAAAREGLDKEHIEQAAENVTDGLKAVAERGVSSALNGNASDNSSDARTESPLRTTP